MFSFTFFLLPCPKVLEIPFSGLCLIKISSFPAQRSISVVIFISCRILIILLWYLHKLPPTTHWACRASRKESQSVDYITWFDTNYVYQRGMKLIHSTIKSIIWERSSDACWDPDVTTQSGRTWKSLLFLSDEDRSGDGGGIYYSTLCQTHSASLFPDSTDPYFTDSISKDWWFIMWLSWDTLERQLEFGFALSRALPSLVSTLLWRRIFRLIVIFNERDGAIYGARSLPVLCATWAGCTVRDCSMIITSDLTGLACLHRWMCRSACKHFRPPRRYL